MSVPENQSAALVALALEPARYVYRARRQDGTTWWEVIQGYREGGDIEPGTEHPVIRFLPQPTADAFAHALTDAFDRGRKQGYEHRSAKTSSTDYDRGWVDGYNKAVVDALMLRTATEQAEASEVALGDAS